MFREVQLRPAFAATYPGIDPGHWYTAAALAGQVKGTRILREGPAVQFGNWILPPNHFEFRGGSPRSGASVGLRTRRLDRHPGPVEPSRHELGLLNARVALTGAVGTSRPA
jgi:hypothetical protein